VATIDLGVPAVRPRPAPEVDAAGLAAALGDAVEGEVRFDQGSRGAYSTDASNYRQVPIGVVVPRTVEDVVATVATCRAFGAPVLSRGGGTSLAGAVDCLQADVSRCAGVTEWLRVAALAAAHNLELSGHCAQSLSVHAAAAVPNLRHLEYFADHARTDRLLFDGVLEPAGGVLRPDLSRPGMGLELRRADAQRYREET
jgi:hypothetical protein